MQILFLYSLFHFTACDEAENIAILKVKLLIISYWGLAAYQT